MRADDSLTLNAGLGFQGIRTGIFKKPYIHVIFRGGPEPLSPVWIRACSILKVRTHMKMTRATIFNFNEILTNINKIPILLTPEIAKFQLFISICRACDYR